jgi:transcriptional regulator with XRE-family HTH domain
VPVVATTPRSSAFLISRLRALRVSAGLTQSDFAEIAGMSAKVYQHIEAGRRVNLELRTLDRLACVYGLTLHELFAPKMPAIELVRKPTTKVNRRA